MSALLRLLPTSTEFWPWLQNFAIRLLARTLNLPASLVQAAGLFMFLRMQAFEDSIGASLCPLRLMRRLIGWLRG